jgi:predicted HAD superfamily Cof-like phosphohydrolase
MSFLRRPKKTDDYHKKTSNFYDVIEFNKSFGVQVNIEEQPNIFRENPKLVKLRYSLINEEVKELKDAFRDHDFIEVIDALTDILYVVYGAGASFGIDLDDNFNSFCLETYQACDFNASNFQKVKHINKDFVPVSIRKDLFNPETKDFRDNIRNNYLKDVEFYCDKLHESIENEEFELTRHNLVSLTYYTYRMGVALGINLDQSFDIVHKSNMSKLCRDKYDAMITVDKYKRTDKRYNTPDCRLSDNRKGWVIFNRDTGKILKSYKYTPADFKIMLN